jgi:transcriptional regulator with XRE-family HTH domain
MSPATPRKRAEFPQRLAKARERRGWSQAELAEKAGFQPSAISRFETGAAKPSFENLRRLARALRVPTDFLLGLVDEPTVAAQPSDALYRKLEELTDEQRAFAEKFIEDLGQLGKKR